MMTFCLQVRTAALVTLFGIIGFLTPVLADIGFNNEGDPIAFYNPSDSQYPGFAEDSFSVPRPVVFIDPVVFGSPEQYPGHTTIQQVGPDTINVRIRGRVYDFLADMVADNLADIEHVRVTASISGWTRDVGLTPTDAMSRHPLREYLDKYPALGKALRPFPFGGRLDSGEIELQVHSGYNAISIAAINSNDGSGTSTIGIRATTNHEEGRYDITADVSNSSNTGLCNPVLVYVNDPSVTPGNVGNKHATLNGVQVGLRFIEGQLQLDRPITFRTWSTLSATRIVSLSSMARMMLYSPGVLRRQSIIWTLPRRQRQFARPVSREQRPTQLI